MASVEPAIAARVRALALPIVEDYGLELVDVEYLREPAGWVVRVMLDKEGGISLDDCSAVSRELGYVLEVKEVISHPYNLEVSSPGLDRPLKTERDFERFAGKKVSIKTRDQLDGRRNFKGILRGLKDGYVLVEGDAKSWNIPFGAIAKAKLIYEFPQ